MTHVDLFSGIGGFAMAADANGLRTVCFCEIDKRCRNFLGRAWPGTDIHDDIRTFDGTKYNGAFLLTAGVPCQPASRAGKQRGAADDRWLWPEAIRVLGQVKPAWAIFENPPGIGDVGLDGILSDVAAQGYDFPRDIDGRPVIFSIPACAVGAPHRRERFWIVAHNVGNAKEVIGRAGLYDNEQAEQRRIEFTNTGQWSNFVWLPCADGKLRRAPDDSIELVDGLQCPLPEMVGPFQTSLLEALGNSIVPQVASVIIYAIILVSN